MSQKYDFIPAEYLDRINWQNPKDYMLKYARFMEHSLAQHKENILRAEEDIRNMRKMTTGIEMDIETVLKIAEKL